METLTVSKLINAPISDVWESWNDFGNIFRFNPGVSSSRLLSDANMPTGIGTRRESELNDGKNWLREKVVEYEAMRRMKIDVYESSMPVESMYATLDFRKVEDGGTHVTMTNEFEPGMGMLGKLMAPLMRRRFQPMLAALLDSNAKYVEQGLETRRAA